MSSLHICYYKFRNILQFFVHSSLKKVMISYFHLIGSMVFPYYCEDSNDDLLLVRDHTNS